MAWVGQVNGFSFRLEDIGVEVSDGDWILSLCWKIQEKLRCTNMVLIHVHQVISISGCISATERVYRSDRPPHLDQ